MKAENCYFWTDETIPEDKRTINVLCMECHEKNPELGWFWEGSRLGYGPFEFVCNTCGHVVHNKPSN